MYCAIGVLPTKLTAFTSGWASSASTATLSPCTTLNTPSGRPACFSSSAMNRLQLGSRSLGFRMKALPVASASGNIHSGTMHGKVERRDAGHHAQRLAQGVVVDAGGHLVGEGGLQQLGRAAGEFDDVDAARHLALGVGEHLAMLGADHRGQRVLVLVQQRQEIVQHPRAADRWQFAPGRLGRHGVGHGGGHLVGTGQRHLARHRPVAGL